MLSRVAERLFWSARYLERVENIVRLISVYDELLFDLPKDVRISWYNLIEISGNVPEFTKRYKEKSERNVVRFLMASEDNPGSMLSSLKMVRENIRTTRDVVPEEMWELINELDIYARKNLQKGISRGERYDYLNTVLEGCRKIIGLLSNAMSRDAAWSFIIMGRYLERADMNTRILDSAVSLKIKALPEEEVLLEQIIWPKVLKSQSAYQNYLRTMRCGIDGVNTTTFLLTDSDFPRSQAFCLKQIKSAATYLPRHEEINLHIEQLLATTYNIEHNESICQEFSDYLNDIQLALINLQAEICETWFNFDHGDAA